jgi:Holliday junction resolvase RusA-like endonuclease
LVFEEHQLQIMLDLPTPTSTNRMYGRGRKGVHRTTEYVRWAEQADMVIMAGKQYPKTKITGPFAIEIFLSTESKGDGDNRIKALLDYLQSRDIVRNDVDCQCGRWEWVAPENAPAGCRVVLRAEETEGRDG